MAGESPDRSKQRESSEEPTSGSAGPVPEARTGSSQARDPRLTVTREEAKRSADSGGGVDTATRVLSVRDTESDADASGEDTDATGAPEASAGTGAPSDASDPTAAPEPSDASQDDREEEPAPGNDGRLRDVVAAWVATADERAAANARPADGREAEDAEQTPQGGGDGDATEAGTASPAEGAEDGKDDEDGPRRETAQPREASGHTADSEADATPVKDSATDTTSGSDSGSDAPAASGKGSDTGSASGPGSAVGSHARSGSDTAYGTDSSSTPDRTAGTTPASGPDTTTDTDTGRGSASGPGSDTGSHARSGSDTASGTDSSSTPDRTAGTTPASGPDTTTDMGRGSASGPGSAAGSGSRSGSSPASVSGSDTAPDAGTDTDPVTGSETDADRAVGSDAVPAVGAGPEPDGGSDSGPASGEASGADSRPGTVSGAQTVSGRGGDAGKGDGAPSVDQPTAVFKTPRKPAVDQPTTMLKLGNAASAAEKAGQKGDAPARSESDAERTSKFVALRNPDDPANRQPPQPPQAAQSAQTSEAPKAPQAPRTGVTAARPHVGPDRTTQQPLPPKPPLDLLAELTNTPPPPETPLRTTMRRVKIWTPLVLLLVIILGVVQSMRPLPAPTLDLTAQDSFTFEGGKPQIPWPESGQAALDVQGIGSFGSSGDQKPVPIASVAKVMTAYVILRDHPLKSGAEGPKIKIDQAAEDQSDAGDESTVNVYAGDSISQREALKAVLIASANNVARLLARWDAGSEKAFVAKMNAAAKDLGMTNTTYTDPSGLNNTTVSTAVDQVKLAKEAMKSPAFREVAAMMSYNDYKGVNHGNWNHLVGHNGVVGIKTGTTTSALGNLVFAAKKEVGGETRTIVGAVVRQPDVGGGILDAALDASDELIRAAQDTLRSSTVLKKGSVVGYVDDGLGGRTPVVATKDVKAVGWGGLTVKLTFDADEVPHTAKAGTKVGSLTVGDGGTSGAVKVPVALGEDLVEPGFSDKLTRLG
ncbi:D-alanyl-D-alanine carboxypeptidase [Streptomyces sp. NPDC085944]|uniref:D-alanyl-D-alanine carboxypeptidase n=1 Tax=Streptomyces sp. NPDC085944 TaxID=3154962 RepID=UPI003441A4DC